MGQVIPTPLRNLQDRVAVLYGPSNHDPEIGSLCRRSYQGDVYNPPDLMRTLAVVRDKLLDRELNAVHALVSHLREDGAFNGAATVDRQRICFLKLSALQAACGKRGHFDLWWQEAAPLVNCFYDPTPSEMQ